MKLVGSPLIPILCVVALCACATTPPEAEFQPGAPGVKIAANDSTTVSVLPAPGVTLADFDKLRLTGLIQQRVDLGRMRNPASAEAMTYAVEVLITRYERGSAFARAMLAGLGQIHLDATITVFEGAARTRVTEFKIDKTFAWGGMYGGMSGIEDIEPAFADGIATALTGVVAN
jgi:hypothetical protein